MMTDPIKGNANQAKQQRGQCPNKWSQQNQRAITDKTLVGISLNTNGKHDVHHHHRHDENDDE